MESNEKKLQCKWKIRQSDTLMISFTLLDRAWKVQPSDSSNDNQSRAQTITGVAFE